MANNSMRFVLILVVMTLFGCGGVNTRDEHGTPVRMTEDEFAAYAERVFRHHNGVVNDLILASSLSDDPDVEFEPALLKAEERMVLECQPLNAMVSATIEGREMGMWAKLLLINQVPDCAAASQAVERLVPETF